MSQSGRVMGDCVIAVVLLLALVGAAHAELAPKLKEELGAAKYVYIASSRKAGELGKPAEIWFLFHDGAVYVASPPTAWRVKRIRAGRPKAKIFVGKPDGSSFTATGKIVDDPKIHPVMFETFAKKYPEGWARFEPGFRKGLKDGSRVLIRYVPD